ncbi:hypothetical protein LO772_17690 [Yinghuangia sp. ASG 101]|uniref:hypothetical protein n=1 Tax=Yinghuangia sp. ASG 101 TaxID=2896848 RepID=UPI001E3E0E16|nr:hypothetical protein [Yinghuangia sp. ASG 101]UGQ15231.1 hypothetical protein LO772_17690 [Yinghuangia sp. ASG 101]
MRKPYPTRIRTVVACVAFTALAALAAPTGAPGATIAVAAPEPTPQPSVTASAPVAAVNGLGAVVPRAEPPDLLPDPGPRQPDAPGHAVPERPPPGPTPEERDRLLTRVAPYGIAPVTDAAGAPALTVEGELVLSGGPDGIAAMRADGLEVLPGPRAGVSVVRSGGRVLAWYLDDSTLASAAAPPRAAEAEPSAVAASARHELPDTGPDAAVPIGLVGLLLVVAGAAVVHITAARRPGRR